jgi:predicted HTH domain antitoxin
MIMAIFQAELPNTVNDASARFALAAGLIYQGGGIVTVAEAARIAGMELPAFVQAARALGEEMEEMVEQAFDLEAIREAEEDMAKPGGEPIPWERAKALMDKGEPA